MSVHVRTRGLVAYFRRRIPDDLKSRFGRSEIVRSLGSGSAFEAEASSRIHWMATQACFQLARMDKKLTRDELNRLIDHYVDDVRAALVRDGTAGARDGSRKGLREDAAFFKKMAGQLLHRSNDSTPMFAPETIAELGAAAGLQIAPGSIAQAQAEDAMTRALAKLFAERAQQISADLSFQAPGLLERLLVAFGIRKEAMPEVFSSLAPREMAKAAAEPPSAPPLHAVQYQPVPVQAVPVQTSAIMPVAPPVPSLPPAPLFSELWPKMTEEKITISEEWAKSRGPEIKSTANLVIWLIGDMPLNAYTREMMAEFFTKFGRLPNNHNTVRVRKAYAQYARKAGDTAESLIAYVQAECGKTRKPYPKMNNKTSNKHLANLRMLFSWAKTTGVLPMSFLDILSGFDRAKKQRGKHGRAERDPYSPAQIKAMFEAPVWTGQKSEYFYSAPGDALVLDSLYWAPLMAAFHGMRREEICQLRVRHIVARSGIWFVNLKASDLVLKVPNDSDDSGGSAREVPLHKEFLRLDFINEVIKGRQPDDLLFPDLSNDNASASFGLKFGKRFLRVQRALDVFEEGEQLGIHRFRHNVITQLENLPDVKDAWIEELCGHSSDERVSEIRRYSKTIALIKLQALVNRVTIPINVDHLLKARQRCKVFRLPTASRPDEDEA